MLTLEVFWWTCTHNKSLGATKLFEFGELRKSYSKASQSNLLCNFPVCSLLCFFYDFVTLAIHFVSFEQDARPHAVFVFTYKLQTIL